MSDLKNTDARIEHELEIRSETDLELEPITSEDEDYENAPSEYKISTYPADFTLEVLYQKWNAKEFIIPEFQRRFVWKQVQASKLIESFLVGLPVPAVFLYTEPNSQKYFVIDGQQRFKSVFYFFEGYYGEETKNQRGVFRLTGLSQESKFYKKTFGDLRDEDKRKLNNSVLRSFVVQQLDPNDDTSMYHIFERLNTGGTFLANQEIRNCVFNGSFIKFLDKINLTPAWREILGKDIPDTRKKDIELLTRFFAMRDVSSYDKPMKDFLSKFVKKNRDPSKESLNKNEEIHKKTCENVIKALGPKPFHIRAGMNAAVFDAVTVGFSKHLNSIPDNIKDRYKSLIKNENFNKCTRQATTDVETVKERIRLADEILFD